MLENAFPLPPVTLAAGLHSYADPRHSMAYNGSPMSTSSFAPYSVPPTAGPNFGHHHVDPRQSAAYAHSPHTMMQHDPYLAQAPIHPGYGHAHGEPRYPAGYDDRPYSPASNVAAGATRVSSLPKVPGLPDKPAFASRELSAAEMKQFHPHDQAHSVQPSYPVQQSHFAPPPHNIQHAVSVPPLTPP